MSYSVNDIQQAFKQLRSSEVSTELPQLLRQAKKHSWTYLELLTQLTDYELNQRETKSIQRRLKWAKFPYHKTLNDYHVSEQTVLSQRQLAQLQDLNWVEQQYNLIFLGPPGVGETALSIGLGIEAIQ